MKNSEARKPQHEQDLVSVVWSMILDQCSMIPRYYDLQGGGCSILQQLGSHHQKGHKSAIIFYIISILS